MGNYARRTSRPTQTHGSYEPPCRAELIIIDDGPNARLFRRLADHSSPTAELQRDLGDLDRQAYRDGDRSVIAQLDGRGYKHAVGADTRRLPVDLSRLSRATLPPDFRREFQRNPNACPQVIHACCDLILPRNSAADSLTRFCPWCKASLRGSPHSPGKGEKKGAG
jgi:hypothetical protein